MAQFIGRPVSRSLAYAFGGPSIFTSAGIPSWFPLNRKVVFYTDSIGGGAAASNSVWAYPYQALRIAGILHHPLSLMLIRSYPGQTSTTVMTNAESFFAADAPAVPVFQFGTNNDGQGLALSVYQADVARANTLCGNAGVVGVLVTAPPRGSTADPTVQAATVASRNWIAANIASFPNLVLADAWNAMQVGGVLPAAYWTAGDDVHPNDLGHTKMAKPIGAAIKSRMPARTSLVAALTAAGKNLISNGLFAGTIGGAPSPSWSNGTPASTGTASTQTVVASPNDAFSSSGQGYKIDLNAAADSQVRRAQAASPGFAVGDKLLALMKIRVDPLAADWDNLVANLKTARANGILTNGSTGANAAGLPSPTPALDQEWAFSYVVPAGMTVATLQEAFYLPAGAQAVSYAYEAGVFNLTQLGYADTINV